MSVLSEQHSGQSSSGGSAGGYGGVVSAIRERRENRQTQNWSAYSDLLRSLAAGESVDDTETDICLSMVGRSLEDLETDVATMRRRLAWAKLIEEEPQRLALERQREQELQTALDELYEAKQRLGAVVAEKQLAHRAVADRAGLATDARTKLINSCMDQGVLHREQRLMALIKELIPKIQDAEHELSKRKSELVALGQSRVAMEKHAYQRTTMVSLSHPPISDDSAGRERWLRQEVEANEQHLQQLRIRMAELQQEQSEISQQKLLP